MNLASYLSKSSGVNWEADGDDIALLSLPKNREFVAKQSRWSGLTVEPGDNYILLPVVVATLECTNYEND